MNRAHRRRQHLRPFEHTMMIFDGRRHVHADVCDRLMLRVRKIVRPRFAYTGSPTAGCVACDRRIRP